MNVDWDRAARKLIITHIRSRVGIQWLTAVLWKIQIRGNC
jgi:hypothetical protein